MDPWAFISSQVHHGGETCTVGLGYILRSSLFPSCVCMVLSSVAHRLNTCLTPSYLLHVIGYAVCCVYIVVFMRSNCAWSGAGIFFGGEHSYAWSLQTLPLKVCEGFEEVHPLGQGTLALLPILACLCPPLDQATETDFCRKTAGQSCSICATALFPVLIPMRLSHHD